MGPYLGDYLEDTQYLDHKWDTNDANGASITRATDGTISVYKGNSDTQSVAGITDTEDFDGLTGIHHLRIDLSADAFYEVGYDYSVVLSAATIDGEVVNAVLATFSIENRFQEVDVVKWLGQACAAVSVNGVPEVDLTYIVGAAVATGSAQLGVNVVQVSGDGTAADNIEATYDGTGYTDDAAPFTQEQGGKLASGTAAINTTAESFTKAGAEPETNTYTSTVALDGTYHIVEDDGGSTNVYYQADIGGNGVPVGAAWTGYAQSNGDSYGVYAYNYGTSMYEQIGTINGANGTTPITANFQFTIAHVGTGANLGKVRLRFQSADGTALATDRLLFSYAIVSETVGYADGAIWVDTNASNTNTEPFVDGTADNPVSTWAAVLTLMAAVGTKKVHVVNGSSITLSANSDNYTIVGNEYDLLLNGQSVDNAHIEDANVSGTGVVSAGEVHFRDCIIGTASLEKAHFATCGFTTTLTFADAVTYVFDRCYAVGGGSPPVFDFGGAVGNTITSFRNWHGGLRIDQLGANGTDKCTIQGSGKLTINSDCSSGTIGLHGTITIADNVAGGFVVGGGVINDDSRIDQAQILEALTDDDTRIDGSALNTLSGHSPDNTIADVDNITGLENLSQAEAQTAATAALNAYDPPTRAELTTDANSIITEVDANETKIDALENLSQAESQAAATAALNAYDPPTRAELTTDKDEIITEIDANETKIDTAITDIGNLNDISVANILAGVVDGTIDVQEALTDIMSLLSLKGSTVAGNVYSYQKQDGNNKVQQTIAANSVTGVNL